MNDEQLNMSRSSRADETAEDIFARIQRRRALAMNGTNTERGALRHEGVSSKAHPTAVAGESLADILRRAAAKEASAPHGAGSAHDEQTGAAGHGNSPRRPEGSASAGTTEHTGSGNNSAFRNFRGNTASGPRTRPPVDYPLLVDEDGTPIDEDAPDFRDDGRPNDSFPRSKTMQALLRYPTSVDRKSVV